MGALEQGPLTAAQIARDTSPQRLRDAVTLLRQIGQRLGEAQED